MLMLCGWIRVNKIKFMFAVDVILLKPCCHLAAMCLNSERIWPINLTSPVQRQDYHRSSFTRYISFPARCLLPSHNIFLQTFACLAGFTCLFERKRGKREWKRGEKRMSLCVCKKNDIGCVCLSQPTSLLRCCYRSLARQMASIWSGRCCNGGPRPAKRGCYWVFMSRPYFQSARQWQL